MTTETAVPRPQTTLPESVEATQALLQAQNYVAGEDLATSVFLALKLQRPLFLEGDAGVGKTEIAKVLAAGLGRNLVRMQCYEGLDVATAVYDWNYLAQMTEIRLSEATGTADRATLEASLYSERFLIRRPILEAISFEGAPPVFLIDELDRADEAFEAYLLEVLSDFQVTIPEIGRVAAAAPPIVIITTNRTREVHDALKRRCLYHWVDYPTESQELDILRRKMPDCGDRLSAQIVAYVQKLRSMELFKNPGIAETIDWCRALMALDRETLDPVNLSRTLGALLKYQDDVIRIQGPDGASALSEVLERSA